MPPEDRKLTLEELDRIGPEQYKAMARHRLRFILDDVRSRHNTGSIFRTADAFALDGLDLCGFTPLPPHREIEKTALGATLSVPWVHHARTLDAVLGLKAAGWEVWAVEQTVRAVPITQWAPRLGTGVALVLGNELHGVDAEVVGACHGAIVVPQGGTKHSLNVAVCAGIVAAWAVLGRSGPAATDPPAMR